MACYWPDQSFATNFTPCDTGAEQSHCCAKTHYCYTNGLCMVPAAMSIYRGACTDETWGSPACSSLCKQYSGVSGVWPCGDANSNWACYPPDCTNSSLIWQMPAGKIMQNLQLDEDLNITSSSSTSSTKLATATSTRSSTSSTSTLGAVSSPGTNSTDATCPSHVGEMAGIGVGVGLPLLVALAIVSWFWFHDRKKQTRFQAIPQGPHHGPEHIAGPMSVPQHSQYQGVYQEAKWMGLGSPSSNTYSSTLASNEHPYGFNQGAYRSELPYDSIRDRNELDTGNTTELDGQHTAQQT